MGYSRPIPCGLDKLEILDFSEKIFNALQLYPGAELERIVASLKGKIDYLAIPQDNKHIASITVELGGEFTIHLSSFIFPLQKRFAIAHELGHLFLHSRYGKLPLQAFNDNYFDSDIIEREASIFACGFLMPTSLFKERLRDFNYDSVQIASFFMVPEPIVRYYLNLF